MTQHPYHKGVLAAFGYNAGQRHIRVFGHVRNLKNKKLSRQARIQKDQQVLGALTLAWNIIATRAPKEAVDILMRELEEVHIPLMSTDEEEDAGVGYTFEINGKTYTFPTAKRSPSEAYMSQNYSA
ncbi:hypothetical protein M422DRAFT_191226, partial [Sphaerobolus stellatus SS14]